MPATLSDNFNDNSIDAAKWDVNAIADYNAGVTVAETGGQLVVTPLTSTAGSNRNGLISDNTFNFTNGFAAWKVEQAAAAGANANAVTRCGVYLDANNWVGFQISSTALFYKKRAVSVDSDTNVAYSAANHKYLMLHHSGAVVNWYTSADGITWASGRSGVAPGFAVTALKKFFDCGTTASVAVPGTAIFEDVSIGTIDKPLPFEQLAAFGGKFNLNPLTGFPLNISGAGGGLPDLTEGQGFPLGAN